MDIDERLQFLLRSTESLHSTAQENTAQIAANAAAIANLDKKVAILTDSMTRLSESMIGLGIIVGQHGRRLNEGGL